VEVSQTAFGQACLLAFLAFLVRALHLRYLSGSPTMLAPVKDEWEHWDLAGKLAEGNWLGHGLGPYFRPQLFAYALATMRVCLGGSLPAIHLVLGALDAATVGLTYLLLRRVYPRRAAFLGAGCLVVLGPMVYFAATLNKESFGIHFQAWTLLCGLRWALSTDTRRRAWWAIGVGVGGGLALLCRPAFALPLAGVLGWMLGAPTRRPIAALGRWGSIALVALAVGACLVPQAWRNVAVGGAPVLFSRHGWLNLYFANNEEGVHWMEHSPGLGWDVLADRPRSEAGLQETDYAGEDRFWRDRFLGYAAGSPGPFLSALGRKALETVNHREVGITNSFATAASLSPVYRYLPGVGLLLPLGLAGSICWWVLGCPRRRRRRAGLLLLVPAVLTFGACALVFPAARDRLAGLVLLAPFAAGLGAVWPRRGKPRGRWHPVLAAGTAAAAFGLVWLPLPDGGMKRWDRWMAACNQGDALAQLWERDRRPETLQAAVGAYEEALAILPEGLQPSKQLSALYVAAGRGPDGLAAQQRVVAELMRRYPRSIRVRARELQAYGKLALDSSEPAAALSAAREWRSLGVALPGALELEAIALAASGRVPAGIAVARERATLLPGDPAALLLVRQLEAIRPGRK
jgi:hypothetical protein